MSYTGLGPRTATGAADTTGRNKGNWTVTFDPQVIGVRFQPFEIYHIIVKGAAGSTFDMWVNQAQWDTSLVGQQNSWDPAQPLILTSGDVVYFFWSDATTDNSPPTVTLWLRYDPATASGL